jgi:hypothetical protein
MRRGAKKGLVTKGFSFTITLFVLGILILSGPVQAFSLDMAVSETNPNLGDEVSFLASFNINSQERIPIDYLKLEVLGPINVYCRFRPDGSSISGCDDIIIIPLSGANYTEGNLTGNYSGTEYGWGYGYGYGNLPENLIYNITLNTTNLDYGLYETSFKVNVGPNQFSQPGENITILEEINITDMPSSLTCAYETDNITVNANITGSIKEVWVETNISGVLENHTVSNIDEIYSSIVQGVGGEEMQWRFVVKDITDSLIYGSWNSMHIVKRTSLVVSPSVPDGLNNWYISEPQYTLQNTDGSELYYRWDSADEFVYSGQFGLENAPNNQNRTGGIVELNYWSNTSCGMEEEKTSLFNVDFTNPQIINLKPANGSTVYNDQRPLIEAYLEEVYQSNSGINKSSVIMKVDGSIISKQIIDQGSLDVIVRYNPASDLALGQHQAYVYVEDNSGRSSELDWVFEINVSEFNLTVNSPKPDIYDSKRVKLNITTSKEVKLIEYINYVDTRPRWKRLCTDCDDYGLSKKKTKTLKEGQNNLTIRATDDLGQVKEENISIFIDSYVPRISRTQPRRNDIVNGYEFYIKYTEYNPTGVSLFINGTNNSVLIWKNCSAGRNQECYFDGEDGNISQFDGEKVNYWFVVEDIAGSMDESRITPITIDSSEPIINSFNFTIDRRRVEFIFNITEPNFEKINYIDYNDRRPRFRSLCTRLRDDVCVKKKSFKVGEHNLTIEILDDAGNRNLIENLNFVVT